MTDHFPASDYDARRIALNSNDMPDHTWHPAALLSMLVLAASTWRWQRVSKFNSLFKRDIAVKRAAALLYEYGFDVDELLKSALRTNLIGEFIRVSAHSAFDFTNGIDVRPELREVGSWILGIVGPPAPGTDFNSYFAVAASRLVDSDHAKRVAGWMQSASLVDLLMWKLPSEAELLVSEPCSPYPPASESQWLCDRFLLTYLDDWNTESLHREYRWLTGNLPPTSVPVEILRLRQIAIQDLNAVIAKRTVDGEIGDPRALLSTAVSYLRSGEIEQAIALFQGALAVRPGQWVRNGLAFCLVPSDANSAREMFEKLLDEGYNTPLIRANLAATYRMLGEISHAQTHARTGLTELGEDTDGSAYLWGFEGNSPVLMEDVSVRDYLQFVLSWN
ncbi:MAG: tetratricopeptide repeat protein [Acidimicrobiales bacterium]